MEQKGVIGTGSVYYELACCLCNNGRWREAMLEASSLNSLTLPAYQKTSVVFIFFNNAGWEDEKA